jgi:hypothetical protein
VEEWLLRTVLPVMVALSSSQFRTRGVLHQHVTPVWHLLDGAHDGSADRRQIIGIGRQIVY